MTLLAERHHSRCFAERTPQACPAEVSVSYYMSAVPRSSVVIEKPNDPQGKPAGFMENKSAFWWRSARSFTNTARLRFVAAFALGAILVAPLQSAEPKTFRLWEGDAPNAVGTEEKDIPTVIVYLPENAKQPTPVLMICPGGGYGGLAMDHEGHQFGKWANEMGMAGVIVSYRHRGRGYGHPNPLLDAQRAIRFTRSHADDWKIDPKRLGIIGFSAGGHLTSTVLTHFDMGNADAPDPIDRQSSRPDYGILSYAVIALGESYTHKGSQNNLLGKEASTELIQSLSNEKQVTSQTPPTFLWHTAEDKAVPAENSLRFYSAMLAADVPGELHVFPKGRHGLGLAAGSGAAAQWPGLCRNWIADIGMIDMTAK